MRDGCPAFDARRQTYNIEFIFLFLVLSVLFQFLETGRKCTPIVNDGGLPDIDRSCRSC
jgi:hypothetical protein